jgi:hypothetical protein
MKNLCSPLQCSHPDKCYCWQMEYYYSLKDKKYKLLEDHDVAVSSDIPHVVRMFLFKINNHFGPQTNVA